MVTKEKKSNKKIFLALILIFGTILLVQFTLARYMTSLNGNSKADIAKWTLKVTDGKSDSLSINLAQTRDEDQEAEVNSNYIGPGTSGKFIIEVDATNTEVSLAYNINMAVNYNNNHEFPKNLIFYFDEKMTNAIYHTDNAIELNGFIGEKDNPKTIQHTIYWKWDFETGQTQNDKKENDIADNFWIGKNISIPISLIGYQVNANPNTNQYAITFDANGGIIRGYGNSEKMTKTITYNEQYGELPVPTRDGYTFAGWTVGDLFDNSSILMEIPNATYENDHYVFEPGDAHIQYGRDKGIPQLGKFEDNTQYTVKIKGYKRNSSEKPVNFRMDFKYKDEDYQKHILPFLNFDYNNEGEIVYTSEPEKTIEYILMTYGYGGIVYISDVRIEKGTISNPYYIDSSTIFEDITNTTIKAEWAPCTNQ